MSGSRRWTRRIEAVEDVANHEALKATFERERVTDRDHRVADRRRLGQRDRGREAGDARRVQSAEPAAHHVAGGVPGVGTVVNRIAIGEVEELLADSARRVEEGDPALTVARWEGNRVGTGKRRQGTSAEPDRHADPKPHLEDRWLSEQEALRNAAEETEKAERRASTKAANQLSTDNTS